MAGAGTAIRVAVPYLVPAASAAGAAIGAALGGLLGSAASNTGQQPGSAPSSSSDSLSSNKGDSAAGQQGSKGAHSTPASPPSPDPNDPDQKSKNVTNNPKKVAEKFGLTEKQVNRAIHKLKNDLPGHAKSSNPDVRVDLRTGEVHPVGPGGRLGDSIGNVLDALR